MERYDHLVIGGWAGASVFPVAGGREPQSDHHDAGGALRGVGVGGVGGSLRCCQPLSEATAHYN